MFRLDFKGERYIFTGDEIFIGNMLWAIKKYCQMNKNDLDIKEGTIEFKLKPGKVDFNDGKSSRLMQLDPNGGSILIVKDSDDKLKFFHIVLGQGRTDVEYDVSDLDNSKEHHFVFTWSIQSKELNIYIDGKKVAGSTIDY